MGTHTEVRRYSLIPAQLAGGKVGKKQRAGKSRPETQARGQNLYFWIAKELEQTLMLIINLNRF